MLNRCRPVFMLAAALLTPCGASAEALTDPLRFFEGRTDSNGTMKVMMSKPHRMRSLGQGRIEADGTLWLVQQVEEEGEAARERRWRIRQTGPGSFAGTMSEAVGEVAIQEVSGRYRFRFKMKGGLSVEQWLTPLAGGTKARSQITVRKLGVTVATGDGMISKLQ